MFKSIIVFMILCVSLFFLLSVALFLLLGELGLGLSFYFFVPAILLIVFQGVPFLLLLLEAYTARQDISFLENRVGNLSKQTLLTRPIIFLTHLPLKFSLSLRSLSGRCYIVLNEKALNSFTPEQLQAILAYEFACLRYDYFPLKNLVVLFSCFQRAVHKFFFILLRPFGPKVWEHAEALIFFYQNTVREFISFLLKPVGKREEKIQLATEYAKDSAALAFLQEKERDMQSAGFFFSDLINLYGMESSRENASGHDIDQKSQHT